MRPVQETRTRFIMRQDEESALAERQLILESYREEANEAKKKVEDAEILLDTRTKQYEALDAKYTEALATKNRQRETIDELNNTKLKMEEDIGKIRQAIGTVKMAEIVGMEE